MKKTSLVLTFVIIFSSLFCGGASAAILPSPSGGVYAQYLFSASQSSDTSKNMSCQTSGEHTEFGLKLTPFTEVADTVRGGTTKVKNSLTSNAVFNVTTAPNGYNDYYVEVEYLNYADGFFGISYTDNTGKTKNTELVCCENLGDITKPIRERVQTANSITPANSESKVHIFRLENVDFTKSADFTIETTRTAKSSRFEYSPKSVYIKQVSVYRENKLPVKAQIRSDRTGNIFYDRDLPEFNVKFTSDSDSNVNFDVDFDVYKYNNSGEAELIDKFSKSVLTDEIINKEESITKSFSINVSEYGLYLLEVNITANGRTYTAATAEFSKCVGNDEKNVALGANVHSGTWDRGTLKNYMTLMRDAGFGLVREGVVWGSYEKSDGTTNLNSGLKAFYKISDEYNMEPYIVIDTTNTRVCVDKNNNGLVDSSALDAVEEYVEKLLDDPYLQNVNHFEINNEPQLKVFYDEDEKKLKYHGTGEAERTAVYTAKGKAYGKICERVIDVIRRKRGADAEIGILSVCGMDTSFDSKGNRVFWNSRYCVDNFVKGALDYLSDPNGDGNKSDSKLADANVITYHPYSYNYNPEIANERILTGIEDIAKSYGLNTKSAWHTEFGWSTAKFPINIACIGDDYAQAKNIVRQYASMFTRNNNDKFFIYDFIDDDIVTNAQESNYGLLHSELYNTPYAAKLSYLAVSNLNKMVGNLPNAEFVYNTVDTLYTGDYETEKNGYGSKGEMVAKFSGNGDKTVYMLWGIEDNKEIAYIIPEDVTAYYDYLGNKIDPAAIKTENGYIVSTEPFYAVCGGDNTASIISRETNKAEITVEGYTNSAGSGDTVIVLISEQNVKSSRNIDMSNIIYADFCTSSNSGYFRFDCGAVTSSNKVYAYIIEADGTETKTEINAAHNNAKINLYKNMQRVGADSISLKDLEDISVVADMGDSVYDNPKARLLISFTNDGTLTHLSSCEIEKSYAEENISVPDGIQYDEVRIFLWDGLQSIKPLCKNIYIK